MKMSDTTPAIPERILHSLQDVAGRSSFMRCVGAATACLVIILAVWLATALALGFFPSTPLPVRIALAAIAWATPIVVFFRLLVPSMRHRAIRMAAMDIQRANPEGQERILSAVEISLEEDPRYKGSQQLVDHLVRQAEFDAQSLDPSTVVAATPIVRWSMLLVPTLILWLVVLVASPDALANGLKHTVFPWLTTTPPKDALTVLPGNIEKAQGETLKITLDVEDPRSTHKQIPSATLILQYPGGQTVAQEMQRTADRSFQLSLNDMAQNFTYTVKTDADQSQPYTVTVLNKPGIKALTITTHYPAYTKVKDKTESSPDGTLNVLEGTEVTWKIETTQKLADTSSAAFAFPATHDSRSLPLVPAADPNTYTLATTIPASGTYAFNLDASAATRIVTEKDPRPRAITAFKDAPPQITISSPATSIKIRSDDALDVTFAAKDDFGIDKIELITQAEGHRADTHILPITQDVAVTGTYHIDVAKLIATLSHGTESHRIIYYLRATDNSPRGQTTETPKHFLDLDPNTPTVAQQQEAQKEKVLADAIQKAREALADAKKNLEATAKNPPDHFQTAEEREAVAKAREELAQATKDLAEAAKNQQDSPYKSEADKARQAAEGPMQEAANNAAKAQMAGDQPKDRAQRQADAQKAQQQIADAQKQLDGLSDQLSEHATARQTEQTLAQMAERQQQIAKDLASDDPAKRAAAQKAQDDLKKQTDEMVKNNPDLQKPAMQAAQQKMDDLKNNLRTIDQTQQTTMQQLQNASDARNAGQKTKELARNQEALNRDITSMNAQNAPLNRSAGVTPPTRQQLEQTAKDLNDGRPQAAGPQQAALAQQLKQEAEKLDQSAKKADDQLKANEPAASRAQQQSDNANRLNRDAGQLAGDISQAKSASRTPKDPNDPLNQKAQQLAQDLQKQAAEATGQPNQAAAAREAQRAADAAQKAAQAGNADEAVRQLQNGSNALQNGAQKTLRQQDQAIAAMHQAQAAADQARDLSQREQDQAAQTDKILKAQREAQARANNPAGQIEQQQSATADQIEQAIQQADQLKRENATAAPELADKAGQVQKELQEADAAQRQAAAQRTNPQAQRDNQQKANEHVTHARQVLGENPQLAQADQPKDQQNGQPKANQQGQQGQPQGDQQNQQANGQQGQQQGNQQNQQANGQQGQQQGNQQNQQANGQQGQQQGNQQSQQANGQQGQQQINQQSQQANGQQGQQQGDQQSQQPNGEKGQQQGGQQSQQANGEKGPQQGGQQSTPTMDQIARDVQAARSAQDQAASGNAQSAQQAAHDLQAAAQGMSQRAAQAQGQGQGQPTEQAPGQAQGQPGQQANAAGGSGSGIKIQSKPLEDLRPSSVKDLGISPADWAKLPPRDQQDLLNAAQQKGPPGYQDMIKSYYTHIARMNADGATR